MFTDPGPRGMALVDQRKGRSGPRPLLPYSTCSRRGGLTLADLRGDLARVRRIGRQLATLLRSDSANYPHLEGRRVALFATQPENIPSDNDAVLQTLAAVLVNDLGYVGEGASGEGLPEQMPTEGLTATTRDLKSRTIRVLTERQWRYRRVRRPRSSEAKLSPHFSRA